MRGDDFNRGSGADPIAKGGYILGTHPDATEAGRTAECPLLRSAVDVDTPVISVAVARFHPLQPEDPGDDGITARGIRLENLAGRPARAEDSSQRLAHADLHADEKFPKWRGITPQPVTDAEFGCGNRVEGLDLPIRFQKQPLIFHAHDDLMMKITGSGGQRRLISFCMKGSD